jgi:glycosyltransferase involved in cell wall biosynthesis
VVLTIPGVPESRITGLRFQSGNDADLAAALLRVLSMTEGERRAIGLRGRAWVLDHFNAPAVAEQTLRFYGEISGRNGAPGLARKSV